MNELLLEQQQQRQRQCVSVYTPGAFHLFFLFLFLHFILRRAITFHCPVFWEISPAIALVILARVPPSSIILFNFFNFFSFPLNNNKCNNELALLSSCMWCWCRESGTTKFTHHAYCYLNTTRTALLPLCSALKYIYSLSHSLSWLFYSSKSCALF